jgi:hypothetical protein
VRKREPQTILKTEEHNLLLKVRRDGKFVAKKLVGTKNRVFLEGDKLKMAVAHPRIPGTDVGREA